MIKPIDNYNVEGYRFGQYVRRRLVLWAVHLGDDVIADAGTPVKAIADGEVVWSEVRSGSAEKRNWGGVIVIKSQTPLLRQGSAGQANPNDQSNPNAQMTNYYSLYGHITDLRVKAGDRVVEGQEIGVIAEGNTPENGWWKTPHLHFGIYTGPWKNEILPGYWRPEQWRRTKLKWWHNPQGFIKAHSGLK